MCAKLFSLTKSEGKLFLVPKSSGPLLARLPLEDHTSTNILTQKSRFEENYRSEGILYP